MSRINQHTMATWERAKWMAKSETAKIAKRNDPKACTHCKRHHPRNGCGFAHRKIQPVSLHMFAVFFALALIWPLAYWAIEFFMILIMEEITCTLWSIKSCKTLHKTQPLSFGKYEENRITQTWEMAENEVHEYQHAEQPLVVKGWVTSVVFAFERGSFGHES